MEVAGLRSPLNESANVKKAVDKNKAALLKAIENRLANDDDEYASDAVEKLIIKTAIEAGMDKQKAEDIPWMETYAVPDEMSAAENLKMLEDELTDTEADGGFEPEKKSKGNKKTKNDLWMTTVQASTNNDKSKKAIYLGKGDQPAIKALVNTDTAKANNSKEGRQYTNYGNDHFFIMFDVPKQTKHIVSVNGGIKSIFKTGYPKDKSGKIELVYTKEKDGTTPLSQEFTEKLKANKFPIDSPKEMEPFHKTIGMHHGDSTEFKVKFNLQESNNESIFEQLTKVKKQLWK
jgi:hypothetical protein